MKLSIFFLLFGLQVVSAIIGDACRVSSSNNNQECSFGEICYRSKCIEGRPCTYSFNCGGYVYTACVNGYCQNSRCSATSYCVGGQHCSGLSSNKKTCTKTVYVNATVGSQVTLLCATSGSVSQIAWFKGNILNAHFLIGKGLSFSEPEYYGDYCSGVSPCETPTRGIHISTEGALVIEKSEIGDYGLYICQSSTFHYYYLNVYDSPEVSLKGIPSEPVVEGTEVSMNCTARSNSTQTLQFYWIIDGRNITGDVFAWQREANGGFMVYSNNTYVVSRQNEGNMIECQVVPAYGNETFAQQNISEILYGPSGTPGIQASEEEQSNGERVTLTCTPPSDSGNPPCSTFTWIRVDGNLNYTSTSPDFRLLMDDFLSGGYRCICSNQIGSSDASEAVEILSLGGEPKSGSSNGGLVAGLVVSILVNVVIVIIAVIIYKRYKMKTTQKIAKDETVTSGTTVNQAPKDNKDQAVNFQQNNNNFNNNTYNNSNNNNDQKYIQPKRQAVSVISEYQELNEAVIGRGLDEEVAPCPIYRESDASYENVM